MKIQSVIKPVISIMVDYAHEPHSMEKVLDMLSDFKKRQIFDRIIHIVSCDGVGRDDWKKPVMGQISYSKADFSIVTTESYETDENPVEIVKLITENFDTKTKIENIADFKSASKYLEETNRDLAMQQSLELCLRMQELENTLQQDLAESLKILIVSTGVGSEQKLWIKGEDVVRDERKVWADLWSKFAAENKL
jgi:folylpolyglutamate synthase/dihydropteroate synthase